MKTVKDSIKLFRFNLPSVIIFEMLIHILAAAVLVPLYYVFCNSAIKLAGVNYLNRSNVGKFFKYPGTYLFILVYLIIAAFLISINISGLIHNYIAASTLKRVGPFRIFMYGLKGAVKSLRPLNFIAGIMALFFAPAMSIIFYTFNLLQLSLPGYILSYLNNHVIGVRIFIVIYLILSLVCFDYTYALHYYMVTRGSFFQAVRRSRKILKGKRFKNILSMELWTLAVSGGSIFIGSVIISKFIPKLIKLIKINVASFFITSISQSMLLVLVILLLLLGIPLNMCFITYRFSEIQPQRSVLPNIADYKDYNPKKSMMREKAGVVTLLAICFVLDIAFYRLNRLGAFNINADYLNTVTITAHRGASLDAPENTLGAFELAINQGADVVELDVRETKDHVIIVQHDETFKRTIGLDKKVGDMTYDEILELSAGAWYDEKYKDEKVPTLEEAIDLIKGRAKLNIELKPASTDSMLIEEVVRIVNEKNIKKSCVVTSLNYNSLKEVKELDPDIKTIYVMSVALGDYYNLKYADGFSIKYTYLSSSSVKNAHKVGKEVYVWTVNSKRLLERLMLLNVDSIITDNPEKMRRDMADIYEDNSLFGMLNSYFKNLF